MKCFASKLSADVCVSVNGCLSSFPRNSERKRKRPMRTMALPWLSLLRAMSIVSPCTAAASPSWSPLSLRSSENLRVVTGWLLFARQRRWHGDTFSANPRRQIGLWRDALGSRRVSAGETVPVKTGDSSLRHRFRTWNILARPTFTSRCPWVFSRAKNRKSLPSVAPHWSVRLLRWNVDAKLGAGHLLAIKGYDAASSYRDCVVCFLYKIAGCFCKIWCN